MQADIHHVQEYHAEPQREVQKFILLTTARSGSTWLSSIFHGHPQMSFHLKECLADQSSMESCNADWGVPSLLQTTQSLNAPLLNILPAFFQTPSNLTWKSHVGFKWMTQQRLSQDTESFNDAIQFMKDQNVKLIALRRQDPLRRCLSLYDMDLRKNASLAVHKFTTDNSDWGKTKIAVPTEYMHWCLDWYETNDRIINKITSQIEAVHVFYKDLCTNPQPVLDKIHNYLHIKMPIRAGNTDFQKIHEANSMYDLMSNWAEVRENLLHTHHASKILEFENKPECGTV